MSWRSDVSSLVADGWVSSMYAGHGIEGQFVPSVGEHGPSLLYPGLVLPAENNDEFRAEVLTRPVGLTLLVINEDSSIEIEGDPGTYVGTWEGFKNGVSYGTSTYTINIGPSGEFTGDLGLGGMSAGGTLEGPNALAGNADLGSIGASGTVGGGATVAGNATLDDVAAGGSLEGGSTLGGGATLDSVAAAGSLLSLPESTLSGDAHLADDMSASGEAQGGSSLQGDATLDEVSVDGGLGSGVPSSLTGDATLDGVIPGGEISLNPPSVLSGDAILGSMLAANGDSAEPIELELVTEDLELVLVNY